MDDILIERPKVDSQPDDKTETSDISKNLVTPGTNKGWVSLSNNEVLRQPADGLLF